MVVPDSTNPAYGPPFKLYVSWRIVDKAATIE